MKRKLNDIELLILVLQEVMREVGSRPVQISTLLVIARRWLAAKREQEDRAVRDAVREHAEIINEISYHRQD